jgi:recombination protein RecA
MRSRPGSPSVAGPASIHHKEETVSAPTLDDALGQLRTRFGPAVAERPDPATTPAVIPTGSLALDLALGHGGVPRGRLTEIYGPDGAGKTTLALAVIAQAQQAGGMAAFIDAEHALDIRWSRTCGVDLDRLILSRPADGEEALEVADKLVQTGALDVLVIDSIAALVPRVELAGEMGDRHPGVQANLLSQALRKLAGRLARAGTVALVTNQLRTKTGTSGQPTYTAGGQALGYYASVRLDLRPLGPVREAGQIIGSRVRVQVTKNKTAPAWTTADLDMVTDRGLVPDLTPEAATA